MSKKESAADLGASFLRQRLESARRSGSPSLPVPVLASAFRSGSRDQWDAPRAVVPSLAGLPPLALPAAPETKQAERSSASRQGSLHAGSAQHLILSAIGRVLREGEADVAAA